MYAVSWVAPSLSSYMNDRKKFFNFDTVHFCFTKISSKQWHKYT